MNRRVAFARLPMITLLFSATLLLCGNAVVLANQPPPLPTSVSAHFSGSGNCAACHGSVSAVEGAGHSIPDEWRGTMMANSARDPFWQAKLESEVATFPQLRELIEDKCTTCHIPAGHKQAILQGATQYTFDAARENPLAMDGVNCTVCHQIQPPEGDISETFTGNYNIGTERRIFGPVSYTHLRAHET